MRKPIIARKDFEEAFGKEFFKLTPAERFDKLLKKVVETKPIPMKELVKKRKKQ